MAYSVSFWLLLFVLMTLASEVDARKKLLGDKSGSTAYLEIKTQDSDALAVALIDVFLEDGYDIEHVRGDQIRFVRLASRMQELSYGSLLNPGSLEVVKVDFFPINQQSFRIECNVSIRSGGEESLADSNVLPLFGRQYKRMLRRVKRAVN